MENVVKKFFDEKAEFWDNLENESQASLSDFIYKHVPLESNMKVLDLGCGTGIISEIIYKKTNQTVNAMDISSEMICKAKEKHDLNHIDFRVDDFYNTKINEMDMIVCFNAYPHFVDIERFVKKSNEVLKKEGLLVIIHNLSRDDLEKCHSGISSSISRSLMTDYNEAKPYLNYFNLLESIDNEEMFKLVFKKK